MRKPRILLDVDGVLSHSFVAYACQLLNEIGGFSVQPDDVDQWDLMAALSVPENVKNEVFSRLRAPGIASSFDCIPGSQEFVSDLQTRATVYAVTSPFGGPFWAHEREEWLYEHYNIHRDQVVSVRDKHVVAGEAFVDDKLSHLVAWADEFPQGLAILWRIPPNRHDIWPIEASSYDELERHLQRVHR